MPPWLGWAAHVSCLCLCIMNHTQLACLSLRWRRRPSWWASSWCPSTTSTTRTSSSSSASSPSSTVCRWGAGKRSVLAAIDDVGRCLSLTHPSLSSYYPSSFLPHRHTFHDHDPDHGHGLGTLREEGYCNICGEKGHRQFECPLRHSRTYSMSCHVMHKHTHMHAGMCLCTTYRSDSLTPHHTPPHPRRTQDGAGEVRHLRGHEPPHARLPHGPGRRGGRGRRQQGQTD